MAPGDVQYNSHWISDMMVFQTYPVPLCIFVVLYPSRWWLHVILATLDWCDFSLLGQLSNYLYFFKCGDMNTNNFIIRMPMSTAFALVTPRGSTWKSSGFRQICLLLFCVSSDVYPGHWGHWIPGHIQSILMTELLWLREFRLSVYSGACSNMQLWKRGHCTHHTPMVFHEFRGHASCGVLSHLKKMYW